jgi:hypothetical protein
LSLQGFIKGINMQKTIHIILIFITRRSAVQVCSSVPIIKAPH